MHTALVWRAKYMLDLYSIKLLSTDILLGRLGQLDFVPCRNIGPINHSFNDASVNSEG